MVMALLIGQAGYAKKNVDQLFKEFRSERNVSKVSIGKITLKLANLFTDTMGVDGIEILEFDDCDQSVKDRLHAAVRELRDPGYETMVSENDEDGVSQSYTGVWSINTATGASTRIAEKVTNTPVLADDGFVYFTQAVPKTGAMEEGDEDYNKFSKVSMAGGDPQEITDKNGKLLTQKFIYGSAAAEADCYQDPALSVTPLFVKNGDIFFSRNDGTTDGSTAATYYYVMNAAGEIRMLSNSIAGPALSNLIPLSYDQGMLAQITSDEVNYLVQVSASGSIFTGSESPAALKNILRGTFTVFKLEGNTLYYADADSRLCSVDITAEELSLPAFGKALKDKLGITYDAVTTNRYSDVGSGMEPLNDAEYAAVMRGVDRVYARFTALVAEGRNLPIDKVLDLAGGRVWSGGEAQQIGLVDTCGGLKAALAVAVDKAGLGDNYQIVELTDEMTGLMAMLSTLNVKVREQITARNELGDLYGEYRRIESMIGRKGIYAYMPYVFRFGDR